MPTTTPMMVFLVPLLMPLPPLLLSSEVGVGVNTVGSDVTPTDVSTFPETVRVTVVNVLVRISVVALVLGAEVVLSVVDLVFEVDLEEAVVLVVVVEGAVVVLVRVDSILVVLVVVVDVIGGILVDVEVELFCLLSSTNPTISSTTLYADALVTNRHSASVNKMYMLSFLFILAVGVDEW
jgi:hypothetical protein